MNKKGLRGFIRNKLPKTWEIVLTRERKLTAFIEYVYENNGYAGSGYYLDDNGGKVRYNYAGYAAQAGTNVLGHIAINF